MAQCGLECRSYNVPYRGRVFLRGDVSATLVTAGIEEVKVTIFFGQKMLR